MGRDNKKRRASNTGVRSRVARTIIVCEVYLNKDVVVNGIWKQPIILREAD
jgi:hypothetical protein